MYFVFILCYCEIYFKQILSSVTSLKLLLASLLNIAPMMITKLILCKLWLVESEEVTQFKPKNKYNSKYID